MKKQIGALALSLALLTGISASADDWVLPLGETIPLGKDVTVWNGHDGYLGKVAEKFLADPEFVKMMTKNMKETDFFKDEDVKSIESFAASATDVLQCSRFYQLRTMKGDVMHTAFALSIPYDVKLSEEQKVFLEKHKEEFSLSVMKDTHEVLDEAKNWNAGVKERSEKSGRSHGISYRLGKIVMTPEVEGFRVPVSLYLIDTEKEGKRTVSLIFTNQTSGKIFEPLLNAAVGDMK